MFKKKNRLPMIITISVVVLVIALLAGMTILRNRKRNNVPLPPNPEKPVHELILYKSVDASIQFEESWMKEDRDDNVVLSIPEETFVSLLVTPAEGSTLQKVDIMDYSLRAVNYSVLDGNNGEERINFVMPDKDMILNMKFSTEKETEKITLDDIEDETETEEVVNSMPYNLTLHGVTANLIRSYDGLFDDHDFLTQFGDTFHIDRATSIYKDVTDITFENREYEGEQDSDKVYHYIYLNEDPENELLSIYYKYEKKYVFADPEIPEPETEETEKPASAETTGSSSTGTSSTSGSSTTSGKTASSYVSFDILKVSENLVDFCGGKNKFYDNAWNYVLSQNLKGEIVGTLSSHNIDAENGTATFSIELNIGKTIYGTYNRKSKSFSYSGL